MTASQRTSVSVPVLQSVCYYSEVVFETGSPGDGGDVSLFVVVKEKINDQSRQGFTGSTS